MKKTYLPDEEIVSLYLRRSEDAIAETDRKYGALLTQVSRNILHDRQESEECVNDVYFEAWKRIPPARPEHFGAWLCAVARKRCAGIFEKQNAYKRSAHVVELTSELAGCLPSPESVETAVENKELDRTLDAFLRSLDERAQIVFMKRYFWSMPLCEIAEQTGLTEGAIKQLLFRTRKKLKKVLEKENLL